MHILKIDCHCISQSSSFLSKEETFKDNNFSKCKPSHSFCTPVWFAKVSLAKRVLKAKCEVFQNLWGRISGQKETWYMWFECESPRYKSLLWLTKELDLYIPRNNQHCAGWCWGWSLTLIWSCSALFKYSLGDNHLCLWPTEHGTPMASHGMILYGVEELQQKISTPADNSLGPGGLLEFQI